MLDRRLLLTTWLSLLAITLASTLLAERADPAPWVVLLVCAGASLKGRLVIERLMGLAGTAGAVRASLLGYFYLLPPLIVLGWQFSDGLRRLTTL